MIQRELDLFLDIPDIINELKCMHHPWEQVGEDVCTDISPLGSLFI